ncbi:MAG: hypothetical protein HGA36_02290 [Candidatus Moranbacteria bacterium]|nr:hypothetical protein [Candidatus Moranbacteria bacterium]
MKNALVDGFRAFLDIKEEEEIVSAAVAKKASFLAAGRAVFAFTDWIIAAGLGAFVFWMQSKNFSSVNVWLATFLYDLVASAAFFFLSDMTKCDFTFGQSFRRVADSLSGNGFFGKIFAGMLLLGVSAKAIIWEGPEVICFLFQKELKSRRNIWLALIVLSALQGLFGAWLYSTGYELWRAFAPKLVDSHLVLMGIATFAIVAIIVALAKKIVKLVTKAIRFFFECSKKQQLMMVFQLAVFIFCTMLLLRKIIFT